MGTKHVLSIFCFLPLTLLAQQENWDVYLAQYEKGTGSTLINMSAKEYAPNKQLPFVLITGVTFNNCNMDGMPAKEQFTDLYQISDSIKAALDRKVVNASVATFTYQCQRFDYYYVKDTIGLREFLLTIYSQYFSSYKPYFNLKEDKSWQAYLTFLYPNDETLEFMRNQKVLEKLKEAGDKLEKARQIDHWIYFATETDQNCFINYITKLKFKIESKEKTKDSKTPYKLQFSRVDKIDLSAISKITLYLRAQAQKCHADYDGWETAVVK